MTISDPERTPVVVAAGQAVEHRELVSPVDLMVRAAEAALAEAPGLRGAVDRLSVVDVMTKVGPAPATELATRLGLGPARCEVTTVGGNSPQWLVSRAASAIAEGRLGVTLIAGAEAIRSSRARHAEGLPRELGDTSLAPDPVVGDDLPGTGPAEASVGLFAPVHVYPLFENVVAARAGHDAAAHRLTMGRLFAPFTEVAAAHPFAWFPERRTAEELATPTPDNRVVAEPYTKRLVAFLGSDQGAALLVCSLAAARRAGVAERAVFVWAGAEAVDVRFPTARPDPGRSPGIAAAGGALWTAASAAGGGGRTLGIDDPTWLDVYSCFPSAVELACEALGLAGDDARGLTVTGGLPYFGGPGNNYTTHGIATVTDRLREAGDTGGDRSTTFGLTTGLGWYVTKHALGLYATSPPPAGFHRGDATVDQAVIDASAVPTAEGVDVPCTATVVTATVVRDGDGSPTAAPLLARLADGRHLAALPADDEELVAMGATDVPGLLGRPVAIDAGAPRYRLTSR